MPDLFDSSALDLSRRIRSGEISRIDVLNHFIDRIKTVNPDINALVVDLFEEARRRVNETEDAGTNGSSTPLAGIPITIKEMISVKNQPITCGSVHRKDAVSEADAPVVRRARNAGAVPVGLTNVPELGLWIESSNPVYGTTKNPHDPERTAGGSSGGEAAIIAAGGSPIGIGSDMGGSIRIPASFCGIYGHKPSSDSIPMEGHFPHEHSDARIEGLPRTDLVSLGPMARHARDLLPLFNVLRSEPSPPQDQTEQAADLVDFSDITAYLLPDPRIKMTRSASEDVSTAVARAGNILEGRGASLESFPKDFFSRTTGLFLNHLENLDFPPLTHLAGSGDPIGLTGEFARKMTFNGRHTLPMLSLCLLDTVYSPSSDNVKKALGITRRLRNQLTKYLDPQNILIMPTYPTVAPYHGRTLLRPFDMMYSAVFNILDLPATAAPVSHNADGQPLGVQIVSPAGQDEIGLASAMALEEVLGSPEPAFPDEEKAGSRQPNGVG